MTQQPLVAVNAAGDGFAAAQMHELVRQFLPVSIAGAQQALDDVSADLQELREITIDSSLMAEVAQELIAKVAKAHDDLDNDRKSKTQELRDGTAWVNDGYRPAIESLAGAVKDAKEKLLGWNKAERQRIEKEAAEARKQAQADADRLARAAKENKDAADAKAARAETLFDEGKLDEANALLQEAASLNEAAMETAAVALHVGTAVPAQPARTSSGVKGTLKVWKARVTNKAMLIVAAANDPGLHGLLDVNESNLNALAKTNQGNAPIPGVEFYEEDQIRSRRK